jgi:hypothetical protein
VRDAGQHRLARGVEVVDDFDAEPVLLERDDGRGERVLVGQRGEASDVSVRLTADPSSVVSPAA